MYLPMVPNSTSIFVLLLNAQYKNLVCLLCIASPFLSLAFDFSHVFGFHLSPRDLESVSHSLLSCASPCMSLEAHSSHREAEPWNVRGLWPRATTLNQWEMGTDWYTSFFLLILESQMDSYEDHSICSLKFSSGLSLVSLRID